MPDDDVRDWLERPIIVLLEAGNAFEVRMVVEDARSAKDIFDRGRWRLEIRGPVGGNEGFLWFASPSDTTVVADPSSDPPQELTDQACRVVDAWIGYTNPF